MDNTKLKTLKVPTGLIRRANYSGLYHDVLFYYKLKSLESNGVLDKSELIELVRSNFDISGASIWRKVRSLVDLGLLVKTKHSYRLISYKKLYKKLNIRKNTRVFNINADFSNFIDLISLNEIKRSLKRQDVQVSKKRRILRSGKPTSEQVVVKSNDPNDSIYRDLDVTLSCKGVAKLLGFKSASIGYKIEQNLKKLNLLKVKARSILIEEDHFLAGVNAKFYKKIASNFNYKNHSIIYNLPNLITVV